MCSFLKRLASYEKSAHTQQPCGVAFCRNYLQNMDIQNIVPWQPSRVAFCRSYLQNMDNQGLVPFEFSPPGRCHDTLPRAVLYCSHHLSFSSSAGQLV
ncbi:hypothetical protein WN943_029355 [Citrus x changshan-huyou]